MPEVCGRPWDLGRTHIMAILNATPDSFSDGGVVPNMSKEALVAHIAQIVQDGATVLDVGGQSTRPGHVAVDPEVEWHRVEPVLDAIRMAAVDVVVSVDTGHPTVARNALAHGAHVINDVTGRVQSEMAQVVRDAGAGWILMRSAPLTVARDCKAQWQDLLAGALAAGVPSDRLVLDPGLGFGEPPGPDVEANLALLDGAARWARPYPVVIGASRKRFVGAWAGKERPADRDAASALLAVRAVRHGAKVVRVHNVAATRRAFDAAGIP